jgi:hypothetical protein
MIISGTEVGTGVSTIDIPSAIRYIQATFAGKTGMIDQRYGALRLA